MGVAVNVTLVPAQITLLVLEALEAMLTLAGSCGFTVIVMLFDVAGELFRQGAALEVNTTKTTSPLTRAAFVYVALLVPTTTPLSFH